MRRLSQKVVGQNALKITLRFVLPFTIIMGVLVTMNLFGFELMLRPGTGRAASCREYVDLREDMLEDRKEYLYEFIDSKLTRLNATSLKFEYRNKTTHIAFLKVHKAGSTTLQNLLFRFGMKHHLNIILPNSNNYLYRKEDAMPIKANEHYDILAVHTTFDVFKSLLPVNSVNIGIVREPIGRMISAAYYYRDVWDIPYLRKVPKTNFIHHLVQDPEKFEKPFFSHTRNTMGHDFGFSEAKLTETNYTQKYLEELNSFFSLVLIVEKFDESLVMMRRLLGWSISDILYLKTNTHSHKPAVLSESEKKKLRQTNFLDFEIYEYFLKEFTKKLQHVEQDFWEEVDFLKTLLQQVKEFCLKTDISMNAKLLIHESEWENEFKVSKSECAWMKTNELQFIEKLRRQNILLHN